MSLTATDSSAVRASATEREGKDPSWNHQLCSRTRVQLAENFWGDGTYYWCKMLQIYDGQCKSSTENRQILVSHDEYATQKNDSWWWPVFFPLRRQSTAFTMNLTVNPSIYQHAFVYSAANKAQMDMRNT